MHRKISDIKCHTGRFKETEIYYYWPSVKAAERFEKNARCSADLTLVRDRSNEGGAEFCFEWDAGTVWLSLGTASKKGWSAMVVHTLMNPTVRPSLWSTAGLIKSLAGDDAYLLLRKSCVSKMTTCFYIDGLSLANHRLEMLAQMPLWVIGADDVAEPQMQVEDLVEMTGDVLTLKGRRARRRSRSSSASTRLRASSLLQQESSAQPHFFQAVMR